MKKNYPLILSAICCVLLFSFSAWRPAYKKPAVLIFSRTNGYHHASIATGIAAIKKLGAENGFTVDDTTDSLAFNKSNLNKYAAVIFLSPTGKVFGPKQESAFREYIEKGGGYVGIHAASDCEYNWPWYGKLVGAYFLSHPEQQRAKLAVVDKNHPSTAGLPDIWERFDEWYNFKDLNPDVHVLIRIDESTYTGGKNGAFHPMAWYHDYDGGKAFYTEMGHTDESFSDTLYLRHILGGIRYAMKK
jgi:type 1 glutamine amidotransferase